MPESLKQISFSKLEQGMDMPHLLDIQTRAFEALLQLDAASHDREDVGLERVFKDLFPITDVHENFSLEFVRYSLGEPKYTVEECIERDMTYSAPLKATLQLVINEEVNGVKRPRNIIEKEVYLGELPLLTPLGTFVINGAERVIVSQLHRSPGVVFEEATHPNGQRLISARIIPFRGSWVEFTVDIHDVIYVHIDKKKKFPATALLRAFGYGSNSDILRLFFAVRDLDLTKRRESRTDMRELTGAIIAEDITLPGEVTAQDAPKARTKKARAERGDVDDIDHLGNRRIRSVGELIANQISVGLSRMARLVKERMSINTDPEKISLDDLVNARTVSAVIQAFFGSSQLSQFMDQTNPLAELTNKRRLSALGPGGLSRDRAGFEVRDVHHSHYGRICPVETPEGPNIGLIGTMSTFARVNEMGFLETPYRKVYREVPNAPEWERQGMLLRDVRDLRTGELIAARGGTIDAATAKRIT